MKKSTDFNYQTLNATINKLINTDIPEQRKGVLQPLIDYIGGKLQSKSAVKLNFICTHNSRRSQLAQIWAKTAADYFGIDVECYAGGTETTAFHPNAVNAIKRAGFTVTKKGNDNPKYFIFHGEDADPIITFSKKYDDAANPKTGFAAIMTCADADANCPVVIGAERRLPVRYEDPKAFDGTPEEAKKYDERCAQIGAEMLFVFSTIKSQINEH